MKLSLIRSMTRSAVFELENGLCYRPAHPFTVQLNGETVYTACETNVFSLFSLLPGTPYTVAVQAEGETLTLDFTTEAETFFVDASRYGLVADGTTDNTGKLQAALSTCPKGGTVYVPAGRYRTSSLFMKSCTTLYLEKGAVLLGDNDRTHYPILPGVIPSENEVDEYYLTGWEGNPLDSFAGLLNITQVHDVVVTGEGTLDCDAQNGDWWINQKVKRIAWRPRAVAAVDSENICLHGITVQNSYSWTIHPIFVKHLDLLNFNINNPYNAPNTDGIDPESCEYIRIIGVNIHVGDDCIAMKASKVFLGMKLKKSCEHTVIRNCLLDKGHGGIVIGSEMSGGVKDMVVTQCLMDHTDRGLRVKTRRGRGNTAVIDGLVFRNVEMRGVKAPFVINMFYFCDPDGHGPYVQCRDAMPVDEYTPKLGSLTMEDIVATDAQFAGCYFDGLPEQPIERVSMKNVTITFDPNAEAGQAAMADNRPLREEAGHLRRERQGDRPAQRQDRPATRASACALPMSAILRRTEPMTHEEILTMLGDYVDYLIANSSAEAPMWNIEKVRSGKPNKWNYIDGCMITACLSLYKTTGDEKYLSFSKRLHRLLCAGGWLHQDLRPQGVQSGQRESGQEPVHPVRYLRG